MTTSIGGTTGVTFPDSSTQNTAATGFGFKNRIINGAMMIDQRNAGASVTPSANAYTLDRWSMTFGGSATSKMSVQQSTTAPLGFINSIVATVVSAYSVSGSDSINIIQRIEGLNCSDFAWGTSSAATVTLSFWVRSSLTGTFGGALKNSDSTRTYPFSYAINSANTWEQKSITILGDTTGTWLTTNGIGLLVNFSLANGGTTAGTAGAWASTNYNSVTGAISVVGTNGATFYITGVQLEKGSTATSFDYRPYGTELALCQRYYEYGFEPYLYIGSIGVYTGSAYGDVRFCTTKRAAPTIAASSWTYFSAGSGTAFSPSFPSSSIDRFQFQGTGLTNWNGWTSNGTWTASAEL